MKDKFTVLYLFLIGIVFFLIFSPWFLAKEIIGGDWPYVYQEQLKNFSFPPPIWSSVYNNGLGGVNLAYFLQIYFNFVVSLFVKTLHLSWLIIYKFFWFGLFIVLSIFSSISLFKAVIPQANVQQKLLSAVIFITNTYILMVVAGGQMGVALSYSLAPLVLAKFIQLSERIAFKAQGSRLRRGFGGQARLKDGIIAGLILAVQVMFDPRIAYITMMAVGVCFLFNIKNQISKSKITIQNSKLFLQRGFFVFAIPLLIVSGLHAFWILPMIMTGASGIESFSEAYTTAGAVKFFSFASFSNTISLLHPNWPENIFGKVYFMRGEFLILPILAFSSLLFLKNPKSQAPNPKQIQSPKSKIQKKFAISQYRNIAISFFAFLALIGAFLAKGANPPFGGVYLWLFEHFPGFVMFRDPTKFYLLTVLSYSVLIPFTLREFSHLVRNYLPYSRVWEINIFLFFFIAYWLFLIKPAWTGQLKGTFEAKEISQEYLQLKNFLQSQPEFFRTLWIPQRQRFSFDSVIHPAIEASRLFGTANHSSLIDALEQPKTKELFGKLSVKYVIIPYDSFGEVFLENREYSESQRTKLEKEIDDISWLKKIMFGKITMYEVPFYYDHFWLEGKGAVSYKIITPDKYRVTVNIPGPTTLIFSENFNSYWIAKSEGLTINSERTSYNLNSFKLNESGLYTFEIFFLPEQLLDYGFVISILTLIGTGIAFVWLKFKKYEI